MERFLSASTLAFLSVLAFCGVASGRDPAVIGELRNVSEAAFGPQLDILPLVSISLTSYH